MSAASERATQWAGLLMGLGLGCVWEMVLGYFGLVLGRLWFWDLVLGQIGRFWVLGKRLNLQFPSSVLQVGSTARCQNGVSTDALP